MQQDRTAEAIQHYEISLRLNPNNPEEHFNLGMALLRNSRRLEAVKHLQQALNLRPDYEEASKQLRQVENR